VTDAKKDSEAKAQQYTDTKEELRVYKRKVELMAKEKLLLENGFEVQNAQWDEQKKALEQKIRELQGEILPVAPDGLDAIDWEGLGIENRSAVGLYAALRRRQEQYANLEIKYQNTKEQYLLAEQTLRKANARLKDKQSEKKIKALEAKLQQVEKLCNKLLESGLYWREQRRKKAMNTRIAMPISGGGGRRKKREDDGASPDASIDGVDEQNDSVLKAQAFLETFESFKISSSMSRKNNDDDCKESGDGPPRQARDNEDMYF